MADSALRLRDVHKSFGATSIIRGVSLDIAAGVLDQLASSGCDVEQVPGCTFEDPALYSYRREQTTGRFAGVAVRVPDRG